MLESHRFWAGLVGLYGGLVWAQAVPEIAEPKHEIGFVCLKDVQPNAGSGAPGNDCGEPFKKINRLGLQLPGEVLAPEWAKKSNGKTVTREEWKKVPLEMTGYEEGYGFKVYAARKDSLELRIVTEDKSESFWIPREKIQKFYSLSDFGVCAIQGEGWWKELHLEDLSTKAPLELNQKIPGDPYKGLEPAGVLDVRSNNKSQICESEGKCVAARVDVDPKRFTQDEISMSRGRVKHLNLSATHFMGELISTGDVDQVNRLVVWDRRGENEFLLKADVYDKPQVWVKIPASLMVGVKFLPNNDPEAQKFLARPDQKIVQYSKNFLQRTSLSVTSSKWLGGQFWYKVKVHFVDGCTDPDLYEGKVLGEYWVPYSPKLQNCPKGC
ncbi:MAG: hypothetical protein AB7N80_06055 [Bdellovibrionales bacterium]